MDTVTRVVHVCAGWQPMNGAANIARMVASEQEREGRSVSFRVWAKVSELRSAEEVWVNCSWKPCLWWAAFWARRYKWMPEASYDPVRLAYHGWKKRLVGPIERYFLRRADAVVATCEAEAEWIRAYEPRVKKVEIIDVKRFFKLDCAEAPGRVEGRALHLLYLGRRHPLKGVQYLESAVQGVDGIELRIVSDAVGEEKEKVWDWCDVLVLPTLSENFGLVVAEALERGKRVITTDGAPAWGDGNDYGGRLVYLKGFRNGTDKARVGLLKGAIAAEVECVVGD